VLRADPWLHREHVYEHAHVRLNFFRVRQWRGELRDHVHAALAWQTPGQASVAPMLPANAPVLAALALPQVYAITHAGELGVGEQLRRLEQALVDGLRLVQLREPNMDAATRAELVAAAARLCRAHGARLLINGDASLARAHGADGVHLTAAQLAATVTRPDFPLVAASCHDTEELRHAAALGCDFAVLGPVKPTATHPDRPGLGWEAFAAMLGIAPLPTFALGGLSVADLDAAQRAGAHGIAAIRAAWDA
jgi:8-oxo-dGTP diphosphatase